MVIISKSLALSYKLFPAFYKDCRQQVYIFSFGWIKGRLVGIGRNNMVKPSAKAKYFADRYSRKPFPYSCSECDLISSLWGKLHIDCKLKIVVVRLNKMGHIGNSKPCKYCQIILAALNIKTVWYSTNGGIFELLNQNQNSRKAA